METARLKRRDANSSPVEEERRWRLGPLVELEVELMLRWLAPMLERLRKWEPRREPKPLEREEPELTLLLDPNLAVVVGQSGMRVRHRNTHS